MSDRAVWLRGAAELQQHAVELRRRIHRRPELGLRLPETAAAVREALGGLDVGISEGPSSSGMIVTIRGEQNGPTILLRGDMDALPIGEHTDLEYRSEFPERMHACGHDAHTAMLAIAARLLHRNRQHLAGTVKLMFQAGEEGYFGARHMIADGLLDQAPAPQAAFALHITPNIPSGVIATRQGPLLAATDQVTIVVTGRGGHASMPHLARDPVPVAFEIATSLYTYIARRVDPFDPVVLSITQVAAGSADNVISDSAQMRGTLRTMSEAARSKVKAAIEKLATQIAQAHDTSAKVTIAEGYPVTMNDAKFTDFVRRVVIDTLGEDRYLSLPAPIMAAEDFSYVLQRIPGCMAFLGAAPAGVAPEQAPGCHSSGMTLDEGAMSRGIAMYAAIACAYLRANAADSG